MSSGFSHQIVPRDDIQMLSDCGRDVHRNFDSEGVADTSNSLDELACTDNVRTSTSARATLGPTTKNTQSISEALAPLPTEPSKGSAGHAHGICRPCAHSWRPAGCSKGRDCTFCHTCDEADFRMRRRKEHGRRGPRWTPPPSDPQAEYHTAPPTCDGTQEATDRTMKQALQSLAGKERKQSLGGYDASDVQHVPSPEKMIALVENETLRSGKRSALSVAKVEGNPKELFFFAPIDPPNAFQAPDKEALLIHTNVVSKTVVDEATLPSIGSTGHSQGTCRPCAHSWRPAGCSKGSQCSFCHSCTEDDFRRRKYNDSRRVRKALAPKADAPPPEGAERGPQHERNVEWPDSMFRTQLASNETYCGLAKDRIGSAFAKYSVEGQTAELGYSTSGCTSFDSMPRFVSETACALPAALFNEREMAPPCNPFATERKCVTLNAKPLDEQETATPGSSDDGDDTVIFNLIKASVESVLVGPDDEDNQLTHKRTSPPSTFEAVQCELSWIAELQNTRQCNVANANVNGMVSPFAMQGEPAHIRLPSSIWGPGGIC
mmetsp:Transcript_20565/g.57125  ORF Transcript_20565/g.57125 Transcript_20565/m.57125 type:complete len:548 (-) Transcript_20565:174-1817(-)